MVTMRIKHLFFDRQKVIRAVDKAKRRVLSRAGAFIRQRARTSIRKRQGSAPPGRPPHSHTGLLRRFILFGYDRASDSVVVGPVRLNQGAEAPRVLEHGGKATIVRRRRGRLVKTRVRIAPRPYMRPALEREKKQLPEAWRHAVVRG